MLERAFRRNEQRRGARFKTIETVMTTLFLLLVVYNKRRAPRASRAP